ncbi:hypothetical protein F511_19816 [Dorcoceras hygrometricum]|uniref:Uncharacterized protein n=1 Tax=Dorcoceras hygrometricum TaxID=472368 RepID=A0A2Z7BVT0_9LAMI|nr:hypothetical protein F511_19816 [Dorcoceras hygrometricum]
MWPRSTHGQRQKLRDLALANNSLQEWYRMEELLERSPTLPQTSKTTVGNDGNHRIKSTMNNIRVRETEVDNWENFTKDLVPDVLARFCLEKKIKRCVLVKAVRIRESWNVRSVQRERSADVSRFHELDNEKR